MMMLSTWRLPLQVHGFGGVPGLDGPGDRRQSLELGAGFGIAQPIYVVLADIVQQRLRRGGEDDLDIGRAGRLGIDGRAGRQRDILDPLGDECGEVGILAHDERTYAALPARDLAVALGWRDKTPEEFVEHLAQPGSRDSDAFGFGLGGRARRRLQAPAISRIATVKALFPAMLRYLSGVIIGQTGETRKRRRETGGSVLASGASAWRIR